MLRVFQIALINLFFFASWAMKGFPSWKTSSPSLNITEKTVFYKLSDNTIPLKVFQYGDRSDLVFINLHDDEITSVEGAKRVLERDGGLLIEVENDLKRNISFRINNLMYRVDPNRIFSKDGIKKSMQELGRFSEPAINEVEKFGKRIIQLIPEDAKCVISLHNNTPDFFSAIDYAPGKEREKEAKKVFLNSNEDPDDFFLTTDSYLYKELSDRGYNTILQDNQNCTDDGSLSVYCGKKKIRYVNCETEHGKVNKYYEMLKALISSLSLTYQQ